MANKRPRKEEHYAPESDMQASGSNQEDVYFMTVALLTATKSLDPSTKVGACIVNQEGNIVGVGYNKMPNGCENAFEHTWENREENDPNSKYMYVCHAELNAIMNKTSVDVKGCTIYVTLFPCNECAKLIIQSGIKGVVYLSNKYESKPKTQAADRMLRAAGIEPRQVNIVIKNKVRDLLASIDPFADEVKSDRDRQN